MSILDILLILVILIIPLVLVWLNGRLRKIEREAEWDRQDMLLVIADEKTAKVAALLLSSNKKVADTAEAISALTLSKLETIHLLVNSNLTKQIQAEKNATIRELAALKEIVHLKQSQGIQPTQEALDAIDETIVRIDELDTILTIRLAKDQIVEAAIKE